MIDSDSADFHHLRPTIIKEGISNVSAGRAHTLAITNDGELWAWGRNIQGSVGDGTAESRHTPVKIMEDVIHVSASANSAPRGSDSHSLAITSDGVLWAWGSNRRGQLGNRTTTNSYVPIKIMEGVIYAYAGAVYTMAIRYDNTLWAWGANYSGQLGDGTTTDSHIPIQIKEDVVAVSTGMSHTIALTTDGGLWAWGSNRSGQLGDGTTTRQLSPIRIN